MSHILIAADIDPETQIEEEWDIIMSHAEEGNAVQELNGLIRIDSILDHSNMPGQKRSGLYRKLYSYKLNIPRLDSLLDHEDYALAKAYLLDGIRLTYEQNFKEAGQQLRQSLSYNVHEIETFLAFKWLGIIASQQQFLQESESNYNKAISAVHAQLEENSPRRARHLMSIHTLCVSLQMNIGDLKSAQEHAALNIIHARQTDDDYYFAIAKFKEITVLVNCEDPSKSLERLVNFKNEVVEIPSVLLGAYYNKLSHIQNCKENYQASIDASKQAISSSNFNQLMNKENIVDCLYKLKKYDQAILELDKLIHFFENNPGYTSSLSKAYYTKALIQKSMENPVDAKKSLVKSLSKTGEHERWQIESRSLLAPIYLDQYFKTKDSTYLDSVIISSIKTDSIINYLRTKRRFLGDQINLSAMSYSTYVSNLDVISQVYHEASHKVDLNLLFKYIEGLKSHSLKELLRTDDAINIGAIPQEILEKEKLHKTQLRQLQLKIYQIESDNPESIALEQLRVDMSRLNQDYYTFLKRLELEFPGYYKYQYNDELIDISELQNLLSADEALIEYFASPTNLHIIIIESSNIFFVKKELSENWNDTVLAFKNLHSNPDHTAQQFQRKAYDIYKLILEEALEKLNPDIKRLRIITDDVLNYIPFETLVITDKPNVKSFKALDYLQNKYTVSYGHSSTFIAEVLTQKPSTKLKFNYTGFAPSYDNESSTLIAELVQNIQRGDNFDLPYSRKNVSNASTLFKGKKFLKEQASIQNFLRDAPHSKIIHLAMHGFVNINNPSFSHILFHGETDAEASLFVNDIYGLNLNADLAVLGACNTGVGELVNGDGIQNMSRAFHFAGVKNSIMSLWSVPDIQTAQINYSFFEQVKKGDRIDDAMRSAKLHYLEESSELRAHPYYWSGMVAHGAMLPLELHKDLYSMWPYLGASIMLLMIVFMSMRKKWKPNL